MPTSSRVPNIQSHAGKQEVAMTALTGIMSSSWVIGDELVSTKEKMIDADLPFRCAIIESRRITSHHA